MTHSQHERRSPNVKALLDVLSSHQVQYILTGSVAAAVYGVEIGTPGDLDITPALDPENVQRLAAALLTMEAMIELKSPAGHWVVQPSGDRTWVVDPLTPDIVAARAAWEPDPHDITTMDHVFVSRHGNFDVVPEISGTYDLLKQRALKLFAFGHTVWVAHVDDLLSTLTVPRRNKDILRVQQLRTIQRQRSSQQHP